MFSDFASDDGVSVAFNGKQQSKAVANEINIMSGSIGGDKNYLKPSAIVNDDPQLASGLQDLRARMDRMRNAREMVDAVFQDNQGIFGHIYNDDLASTDFESEDGTGPQGASLATNNFLKSQETIKELAAQKEQQEAEILSFKTDLAKLKSRLSAANVKRTEKAEVVLQLLQTMVGEHHVTECFLTWKMQVLIGPLARKLEAAEKRVNLLVRLKKQKLEESIKAWRRAGQKLELVDIFRAWHEQSLLHAVDKEISELQVEKEELEAEVKFVKQKAQDDLKALKESVARSMGDAQAAQQNVLAFQAENQTNKQTIEVQQAKIARHESHIQELEINLQTLTTEKNKYQSAFLQSEQKHTREMTDLHTRVQKLEIHLQDKDDTIGKLNLALAEMDVSSLERLKAENERLRREVALLQGEKFGIDERITMAEKEAESARADAFTTTAVWVMRESKYLDTIRELDWENKSFRRQYFPEEDPPPPSLKTWKMMASPREKRLRKTSNALRLPNIISMHQTPTTRFLDKKELERQVFRKTWRG